MMDITRKTLERAARLLSIDVYPLQSNELIQARISEEIAERLYDLELQGVQNRNPYRNLTGTANQVHMGTIK